MMFLRITVPCKKMVLGCVFRRGLGSLVSASFEIPWVLRGKDFLSQKFWRDDTPPQPSKRMYPLKPFETTISKIPPKESTCPIRASYVIIKLRFHIWKKQLTQGFKATPISYVYIYIHIPIVSQRCCELFRHQDYQYERWLHFRLPSPQFSTVRNMNESHPIR